MSDETKEYQAQALESVSRFLVEPAHKQFVSMGMTEAAAAFDGLRRDISAYADDVRGGISWLVDVTAERDALKAALDAEKARSAKAGRDLVLAGEQARERERALNAQMTEAVMAAEARAQTDEDALAAELSARNLSGEVLQRCDAVLNGPPGTHWRSLHDVDVQVAALKARAQTAEDALARLREVAADFWKYAKNGMPMDSAQFYGKAFSEALRATPTDLAEASRREWKAQGMEMVSNLAVPMRDSALSEGGGDAARYLDDLIADIATDAAALRGER